MVAHELLETREIHEHDSVAKDASERYTAFPKHVTQQIPCKDKLSASATQVYRLCRRVTAIGGVNFRRRLHIVQKAIALGAFVICQKK